MRGQPTIAVDIGNSAIKLAWESEAGLQLSTFPLLHPDWPQDLTRLVKTSFDNQHTLASDFPLHHGARLWLVASVNRPATVRLQKLVSAEFSADQWREISRQDITLPTEIRNPETIGIDRLLGAQAAVQLTRSNSVISIDAGSAVTVDLVQDGRLVGGAILPGIRLQCSVLCQGTDGLPSVSSEPAGPLEIPGKDTISAIRSGVLHGIAGAIDRLITLYSRPLTHVPPVVFTGGDAGTLQPLLVHPSQKIDGLVPMAILHLACLG